MRRVTMTSSKLLLVAFLASCGAGSGSNPLSAFVSAPKTTVTPATATTSRTGGFHGSGRLTT